MVGQITRQITTKEVIDRLREIAEKQKISTQRVIKSQEKELLVKESCKTCKDAIIGIMDHSKNMSDNIMSLKEMYRTGLYQMRIGGSTHTRDDIEARINIDKCLIEKNWDRYKTCCKEGKLPSNAKFVC